MKNVSRQNQPRLFAELVEMRTTRDLSKSQRAMVFAKSATLSRGQHKIRNIPYFTEAEAAAMALFAEVIERARRIHAEQASLKTVLEQWGAP